MTENDNPASSSTSSTSMNHFWSDAANEASPHISSIKHRLPHFLSPPLRIQRVNQLDAELLDNELINMLLAPFKAALANIKSTLPTDAEPELLLLFRLALFKLSIVDRGATYGAMLQNLRYRNEWLHRKGLQSTYKDAPLSRIQLALYPLLTILLPYGNSRLERYMTSLSYSEAGPETFRARVWNLLDKLQRGYSLAALVNFAVFLADGKFRTLTDRVLGMRLIYAQRIMNRNVSFEFLNRQLVWHAFTEFLLFLLPLVKPRRLLKKLLRLPTHPRVLNFLLFILPSSISQSFGLYRDPITSKPKFNANSSKVLTTLKLNKMISGLGKGSKEDQDDDDDERLGEYHWLPLEICAICYDLKEKEQGNKGKKKLKERIRNGLPNSDPLDPSSGSLLNPNGRNSSRSESQSQSQNGNGIEETRISKHQKDSNSNSTDSTSSGYSPTGIPYSLTRINIPYETLPCKHNYCYVCLSRELLSEETGEEIQDDLENGGWKCLRCNERVREIRRWEGGVLENDGEEEEENGGGDDEGQDEDGDGNGEEGEEPLFENEEDEELTFDVGEEKKQIKAIR